MSLFFLFSCKQHCHNEIQDGDETGIDCGGKCWSCLPNLDPSVCQTTPNMYGKVYSRFKDTTGISINPIQFQSNTPLFFMFVQETSQDVIQLCNGNMLNNQNLYGPNTYAEIVRYEMLDHDQNGIFEMSFVEKTHFLKTQNCYFHSLSYGGTACAYFGLYYRYQFVDKGDSIYVVLHDKNNVLGEIHSLPVDTIIYYPLN